MSPKGAELSPALLPWAGARETVLPTDSAPPPLLIAKQDFQIMLGASLLGFIGGQVIRDELLISRLLALQAPVESVVSAEDLLQCPHCRKFFTVRLAVAAED